MSDQIENKRTGVGDPYSIMEYEKPLNRQQQILLDKLPDYGSRATIDKDAVSMIDLSALTAKTDNEFAMFTLGSERLIVRGDTESVPITVQDAAELNRQGYKWSGHTHVGGTKNDLRPSRGDRVILKVFNQPTSVIYNSVGQYQTFTYLNLGG